MNEEPEEIIYDEKTEASILEEFATNLLDNIKDLDPEFQETIDNYFWELI